MTIRLALAAAVFVAAPLYAGEAEDAAVKAVEKLGGSVTRDDQDPAHPVVAEALVASPLVTDSGLKELAAFKGLKALDLPLCLGVTDKGMKHVAALTGLEAQDLGYTQVTDAGLKDLAALKGLKQLDLEGTHATDAGVAELQKALADYKIDR